MAIYRVKVTEKHCDYVLVDAESPDEAKDLAPSSACCEYECLYDCEIVAVLFDKYNNQVEGE